MANWRDRDYDSQAHILSPAGGRVMTANQRMDSGPTSSSPRRLRKTFWHHPYADLITKRRPPGWDIEVEKPLSLAPNWADFVLTRQPDSERRDHEAGIMCNLWQHLSDVVLIEFKGPTSGLRTRDTAKAMSYCWPSTTVLHIAKINSRWCWPSPPRRPRCGRSTSVGSPPRKNSAAATCLHGKGCNIIVALLDQVAEIEHDDFLKLFTPNRSKVRDKSALRWLAQWITEVQSMEDVKHLEGYDEFITTVLETLGPADIIRHLNPERLLAEIPPEQRIASISPEQRIASISPEQLPDILNGLDENSLRLLIAAAADKLKG